MNKRQLHHYWKYTRQVKPGYLLAATAVCACCSLLALRSNYRTMQHLRENVYAADKANGDVQGALHALQGYVTTHMNTDLSAGANAVYPPVQLQYTYERLVEEQAKQSNGAEDIYNEAQKFCEAQNSSDFSGRSRVPCIQAYVSSHQTEKPKPIDENLYKFSFASPRWSPDFAGWSIVVTILFGIATVLSYAAKAVLKSHK